MKLNSLIVLGSIFIVLFLSVGLATAADNSTVDDGPSDTDNFSGDVKEQYNARIIAENQTQVYGADNEISIKVVDSENKSVDNAKPYFNNLSSRHNESGQYYFRHGLGVGNYKINFTLDDGLYKAQPLSINLKIVKSTFKAKISCKSYWSTAKDTFVMKATVKSSSKEIFNDGYVTFKVPGKSYKIKVKNGVAVKKIKMKKAGTFTYSARFTNKNYNSSVSGNGKLYVSDISKKARTFNVKGYKIVVPLSKYKKLIKAKNTNIPVHYSIKSNKIIKQTYRHYYKGSKYVLKTVRARGIIDIAFGGEDGLQNTAKNRYSLYLFTKYQIPDSFCTPRIYGKKVSSAINTLNKAKTTRW